MFDHGHQRCLSCNYWNDISTPFVISVCEDNTNCVWRTEVWLTESVAAQGETTVCIDLDAMLCTMVMSWTVNLYLVYLLVLFVIIIVYGGCFMVRTALMRMRSGNDRAASYLNSFRIVHVTLAGVVPSCRSIGLRVRRSMLCR